MSSNPYDENLDIPEFLKVENRGPHIEVPWARPVTRRERRQSSRLPKTIEPAGLALLAEIEKAKKLAEREKRKAQKEQREADRRRKH